MLSLCMCVLPVAALLSLHVESAFLPRHTFLASGEASATRLLVSAARLQVEIWHCRAPQGNHTRLIDGKARERSSETRSSRETYGVIGGKARERELLKLQSQRNSARVRGLEKELERAREREDTWDVYVLMSLCVSMRICIHQFHFDCGPKFSAHLTFFQVPTLS
jgi:hypothetical protein